jgi:hypothetical protein
MLLLTAGLWAARDGRPGDTTAYLVDAVDLAAHTGERNHLRFHFGPTNVAAWELGLAVETGTGPGAAERFVASDRACRRSQASNGKPISLSTWPVLGRKLRAPGTARRCGRQSAGTRAG